MEKSTKTCTDPYVYIYINVFMYGYVCIHTYTCVRVYYKNQFTSVRYIYYMYYMEPLKRYRQGYYDETIKDIASTW